MRIALLAIAVATCAPPARVEVKELQPRLIGKQIGSIVDTPVETITGGAATNECNRLCDEIRDYRTPKGTMRVFATRGTIVAVRWSFDGSKAKPASYPTFLSVVGSPLPDTIELASSDLYVERESGFSDTFVRHIAWEARGHRWTASVLCPAHPLETNRVYFRPAQRKEWRVVSMQEGPERVLDEAIGDVPVLVGSTTGHASYAPRGSCVATGCREIVSTPPIALRATRLLPRVASAEWIDGRVALVNVVFDDVPHGPANYAPVWAVGGIPKGAKLIAKEDLVTVAGVSDHRFRTVQWTDRGVRWTARVFSPLVQFYDPATKTKRVRPARTSEYRIMQVVQARPDLVPERAGETLEEGIQPVLDVTGAPSQGITPIAVYAPHPKYPKTASSVGVTGLVTLRIVVDVEGRVVEVLTIENDPLFEWTSLLTVGTWRYEPVLIDGKATMFMMNLRMAFK